MTALILGLATQGAPRLGRALGAVLETLLFGLKNVQIALWPGLSFGHTKFQNALVANLKLDLPECWHGNSQRLRVFKAVKGDCRPLGCLVPLEGPISVQFVLQP